MPWACGVGLLHHRVLVCVRAHVCVHAPQQEAALPRACGHGQRIASGETPPGEALCWSRRCRPGVARGCQGVQAQTPRLDPQASSSGGLSQGCSVLPCHPHLPLQRWAWPPGSLRERPGGRARVRDPAGAGRHHSQRAGRPARPCGSLRRASSAGPWAAPRPSLFAAMRRLRKWSGVFLPSSAEMGDPRVTGLLLGKGRPGSEPKPPP